ncbi:MAG: hypothetical protein B6D68_02720 [spirochete symbiont of Stewartia floridana]|nr:MAG: hypothetical protein B6D68_02720 [spirochete symbiont of Stewartia floridana]
MLRQIQAALEFLPTCIRKYHPYNLEILKSSGSFVLYTAYYETPGARDCSGNAVGCPPAIGNEPVNRLPD